MVLKARFFYNAALFIARLHGDIMPQEFIQPHRYRDQLDEKVALFKSQLRDESLRSVLTATQNRSMETLLEQMTIVESPRQYYRQRAEFKVWHEGNESFYAMSDPLSKKPILIEQFPVASEKINALMPALIQVVKANPILRKKLFQIEFLSTLTGDTLVTFIYHRPLDDAWLAAIAPLQQQLGIHIIGRSRKQKLILDQDFVEECLTVNGKSFHYQQIEGSFTQPNAKVCEAMLAWAVNNSRDIKGDLLELYCGNGNFTLPLAQNFRQVLATEISKSSVKSAQVNIAKNVVKNVDIVRLSSEEFVQALDKVRKFKRLAAIDLDRYDFSTVFVDPPRAGLDTATETMVKRFDTIIYISCNPVTLCNNLLNLGQTHAIDAIAAFDQFPYTHHLETGVILKAKKSTE